MYEFTLHIVVVNELSENGSQFRIITAEADESFAQVYDRVLPHVAVPGECTSLYDFFYPSNDNATGNRDDVMNLLKKYATEGRELVIEDIPNIYGLDANITVAEFVQAEGLDKVLYMVNSSIRELAIEAASEPDAGSAIDYAGFIHTITSLPDCDEWILNCPTTMEITKPKVVNRIIIDDELNNAINKISNEPFEGIFDMDDDFSKS